MKAWKHFKTITHHKNLVMVGCFKVGLYKQGLLHDLSKYTTTEFFVGCKYFQGTMSPNNAERIDKGYSSAWLHHKGRNKHHLEYWIDYEIPNNKCDGKEKPVGLCGMKMPLNYVIEMYIDRVAAAKNYQKKNYQPDSAYNYYLHGKDGLLLNEDSQALLELLLIMLAKQGEATTNSFIKNELLKGKILYDADTLNEMKAALL